MKESTIEKYKLVIDEYFVNGFNGVKAYQKIYPDSSYQTADSNFRSILEITRIQEYIQEKHNEARTALRTSHLELLREIENWAYSDITETLTLNSDQIKELPPEIRRLITRYKRNVRHITDNEGNVVEKIETVELWFVSKEKAMEMIHKHTGFYAIDNYQKNQPLSRTDRKRRIEQLLKKANADG